MNKKIIAGVIASAFLIMPSANADHGEGVSMGMKMSVDKFVMKYSNRDMDVRMKVNEKLEKLMMKLEQSTEYKDSTKKSLQMALNYLNVELDNFDMTVNSGFSGAVGLNVALQSLLKEHVNLGMNVLRNAYDGDADLEDSLAALDVNTVALADTVGSVYGDEAREVFLTIWRDHIGFFANHTVGLKTNDQEMVDMALEDLEDYRTDIANFFSGAIPLVKKETVIAGSGAHAKLFIDSMIAYDNGEFEKAYQLQVEADTQIEGIANLLSKGIVNQFPDMFTTYNVESDEMSLESKAGKLRLELNDLLREHVNVSLDVLRNAYNGADEFQASLDELDNNTVELAELIGSVYGVDAQNAFQTIWRDHIGFFAAHTTGLKMKDQDMIDKALADLEDYRTDIANLFSGAIPFVMKDTIIAGSGEHAKLLVDSMIAYDDGDYVMAYELQMKADRQIQGVADLLTKGITMQNPSVFAADEK